MKNLEFPTTFAFVFVGWHIITPQIINRLGWPAAVYYKRGIQQTPTTISVIISLWHVKTQLVWQQAGQNNKGGKLLKKTYTFHDINISSFKPFNVY